VEAPPVAEVDRDGVDAGEVVSGWVLAGPEASPPTALPGLGLGVSAADGSKTSARGPETLAPPTPLRLPRGSTFEDGWAKTGAAAIEASTAAVQNRDFMGSSPDVPNSRQDGLRNPGRRRGF
jgi:hypothetical protein